MKYTVVLILFLACSGYHIVLKAQFKPISIPKNSISGPNGEVRTIQLAITETGIDSVMIYSEWHNPKHVKTSNIYLVLGKGVLRSGKIPSERRLLEKLQATIKASFDSSANPQPIFSIPLSLIFESDKTEKLDSEKVSKDRQLQISKSGDTLLFLPTRNFLIFQGLSTANYTLGGVTQTQFHSCDSWDIHNPTLTYGAISDWEGNVYKTINIGSQVWMAENLKSSYFQNGEPIPHMMEKKAWKNSKEPGYCWFENKKEAECPNGKIYNGYVTSSKNNACPIGWRIPSMDDWQLLLNTVGGKSNGLRPLKSSGTYYYRSGDNSSGFSAIPSGFRRKNGRFISGFIGGFWSSTSGKAKDSTTQKAVMILASDEDDVGFSPIQELKPNLGLSIRCIRDEQK